MNNGSDSAKNMAIASMVLGIVAVVFAWFGWGAFVSLACSIVGLVLAVNAKKKGNTSGMQKAGLVLSLIGIICAIIGLITCIACSACAICAG